MQLGHSAHTLYITSGAFCSVLRSVLSVFFNKMKKMAVELYLLPFIHFAGSYSRQLPVARFSNQGFQATITSFIYVGNSGAEFERSNILSAPVLFRVFVVPPLA
jgi:hypothetical protein